MSMERILGIRFIAEPTAENISRCSAYSARFFSVLVKDQQITYNQILYPYADALSLSGRTGTESTRVFGTHILLRNVDSSRASAVLAECLPSEARWELEELPVSDGAAMSQDIAAFLQTSADCELPFVGEFSAMLGGFVTHWRIRECARVFASFTEMSYRRAKGELIGLHGGRLLLTPECDCPEALAGIFTQKTGAGSGGR